MSCTRNQDKDASKKVKRFYSYYILELDRTFPQVEVDEDTLRKYCTTSFLKKMEQEHEYDLILQAQDYYEELADKLVVNQIKNPKSNKYKVCYPPGTPSDCIIVTMKEEQGEWKIDDTQRE